MLGANSALRDRTRTYASYPKGLRRTESSLDVWTGVHVSARPRGRSRGGGGNQQLMVSDSSVS